MTTKVTGSAVELDDLHDSAVPSPGEWPKAYVLKKIKAESSRLQELLDEGARIGRKIDIQPVQVRPE